MFSVRLSADGRPRGGGISDKMYPHIGFHCQYSTTVKRRPFSLLLVVFRLVRNCDIGALEAVYAIFFLQMKSRETIYFVSRGRLRPL